jgi:hypothetical protein
MLFKGEYTMKLRGKDINLKFGVLSSAFFCEEEKITLSGKKKRDAAGNVIEVIEEGMSERLQNPSPMTFINVFYAAAKAYNQRKGLQIDFTKEDVADWIDEIGLEEAAGILERAMQTYEEPAGEKNALTPESGNPG